MALEVPAMADLIKQNEALRARIRELRAATEENSTCIVADLVDADHRDTLDDIPLRAMADV